MLTSKRFDGDYSIISSSGGTITLGDTGTDPVVIAGNLTVSGTLTTVDTVDLVITDNIITLNDGETGPGITLGTAGITIDRGDGVSAGEESATLLFDESADGGNGAWVIDQGDGVSLEIVAIAGGGSPMFNLIDDTTPTLGGSLDVGAFDITNPVNLNVRLTTTGSGDILLTTAAAGEIILASGLVSVDTDAITGYPANADALLFSSGQFTLALPTANVATTVGAPISLTAGIGNTSGKGGALTITAGAGGASANGGNLALVSGAAGGASSYGGELNITAGAGYYGGELNMAGYGGGVGISGGAATTGQGGDVTITGGVPTGAAGCGNVTLIGGGISSLATSVGSATVSGGGSLNAAVAGGTATLRGGQGFAGTVGGTAIVRGGLAGTTNGIGGAVSIFGSPGDGSAAGGAVSITGGDGQTTGAGGVLSLDGGDGGVTSGAGGDIIMTPGVGTGGDADGIVSVVGTIATSIEHLFTERADHNFTPVATRGILWVRSDSPNVLVFTDDAGTDNVLGTAVPGFEGIISTASATLTLDATHFTVVATLAGTQTFTLPTAVGIAGRIYNLKKTGASGTTTLDGAGIETIDGALTFVTTTQYESVTVQSDGANWIII